MAVYPLVHRKQIQDSTLALQREICLLFASLCGVYLARFTHWLPFPADYSFVAFLAGSLLLNLFSWERSIELRFTPAVWRNLIAFFVMGAALSTYTTPAQEGERLLFVVAALVASFVHLPFNRRMGEPGFLIPASLLLSLASFLQWPFLAGLAFGAMVPSAYFVARNLGGSWPLRALAATTGAALGLWLPGFLAPWGFLAIFLFSLETWRFTLRLFVLSSLMALHRFRIYGEEHIPYHGPAVLVGNHVTLLDGWLIAALTQRFARFLVYDGYFKNPYMAFGLNLFRTIPISQGAKRDVIESLREARRRIEEGHVAGIFPEGSVTRSGFLNPYQKGITRVVQGAALSIVPAYMNGLWMNLASFSEGGFQLRYPRFFRNLEIEYGEPISSSASHVELWNQVKALEVKAAFRDSSQADILPLALLRSARRHRQAVALSKGDRKVTYGELAVESLLWARYMSHKWSKRRRVAVFLPHGPEQAFAYFSLALAGQIALEVPASATQDADSFQRFLRENQVGHVLSSEAHLAAHQLPAPENILWVAKLAEYARPRKARMELSFRLSPRQAWQRACAQRLQKDSAVAAVAGSMGGYVLLSHRGVQAAAHAVRRVLWMKPGVKVRSLAPWESSAAILLGFWTPLLYGATIEFGAEAVDFAVQRAGEVQPQSPAKQVLVIESSTETCTEEMQAALGERFCPVLEVPELSGVAAASSPAVHVSGETQGGVREGYTGRLLFGVEARQEGEQTYFRSPQRCLPSREEATRSHEVRPGEWIATTVQGVEDFGFVARPATSSPQTS